MNKLSIAAFMIMIVTQATAQHPQNDSLEWSYSQAVNLTNQENVSISGSFRVHGTSAIDWLQNGGVFTFLITATSGTWNNIAEVGSITYSVSYENSVGLITIRRTSTELTLEIDIDNPSGRPNSKYRFVIYKVEPFSL
jgi:hypothetical protein